MPKSLDERMVEEERNETLYKAVGSLPEIQRRRFLLYYEYEFNFYQIAAMEHCTASAIQKSVFYLCGIGGITYSHFFPWE